MILYYIALRGAVQKLQFLDSSLRLFAMLKIKALMYKDLIFNSRGCRKTNQLLRHPHVINLRI